MQKDLHLSLQLLDLHWMKGVQYQYIYIQLEIIYHTKKKQEKGCESKNRNLDDLNGSMKDNNIQYKELTN